MPHANVSGYTCISRVLCGVPVSAYMSTKFETFIQRSELSLLADSARTDAFVPCNFWSCRRTTAVTRCGNQLRATFFVLFFCAQSPVTGLPPLGLQIASRQTVRRARTARLLRLLLLPPEWAAMGLSSVVFFACVSLERPL